MPRGALAGVRCFSVGREGGVGSAAVFVGSVSGFGSAAGAARGTILTLGGKCGVGAGSGSSSASPSLAVGSSVSALAACRRQRLPIML